MLARGGLTARVTSVSLTVLQGCHLQNVKKCGRSAMCRKSASPTVLEETDLTAGEEMPDETRWGRVSV